MAALNSRAVQVLVDPKLLKDADEPVINAYACDLMPEFIRYVCAARHENEG